MADKLMRAMVTIPLDSGIPEDSIVNVFHFDGDDFSNPDAEYHEGVLDLLTAFYQAIDTVIFGQNIASPAVLKIYDLRDPTPRVPEYVDEIVLTPLASGIDLTLPNEVSICASFQADAVSGQPQARRRGRVFLGPIHYAAAEMVGSQARPTAAARTAIANACDAMAAGYELPVTGSVKWSVYSPRTDQTSTIDDAFHDVTNGWVDNAFDTQRRRGGAPTTRTLWAV